MLEQDKGFDAMMSYIPDGKLCRALGNHDGFWNDQGARYGYTRPQVYEFFYEKAPQNALWSTYYCEDIARLDGLYSILILNQLVPRPKLSTVHKSLGYKTRLYRLTKMVGAVGYYFSLSYF